MTMNLWPSWSHEAVRALFWPAATQPTHAAALSPTGLAEVGGVIDRSGEA
jgi:hypothetical protein